MSEVGVIGRVTSVQSTADQNLLRHATALSSRALLDQLPS